MCGIKIGNIIAATTRFDDNHVLAIAGDDHVIGCPADQGIIARSAIECANTIAANQGIGIVGANNMFDVAHNVVACGTAGILVHQVNNHRTVNFGIIRNVVVAIAAIDNIVARITVNQILPGIALQHIIAIPAAQGIVTLTGINCVVTRTTQNNVIPGTGINVVGTAARIDHVVTSTTVNGVIAATCGKGIIALSARDHVVKVRPDHVFNAVQAVGALAGCYTACQVNMCTVGGTGIIRRIAAIPPQKGVVASTAGQNIIARKTGQNVIARIAAQHIVKQGSGNIFDAAKGVCTIATGDGVLRQIGINALAFVGIIGGIIAVATAQIIITLATGKGIVPGTTIQRIVTGTANDAVIAQPG